jgi:hypothetical protein
LDPKEKGKLITSFIVLHVLHLIGKNGLNQINIILIVIMMTMTITINELQKLLVN